MPKTEPAFLVDIQKRIALLRSAKARPERRRMRGQIDMDWEEALLRSWGSQAALEPAVQFRRKAVRARQMAEGVTTWAVKVRVKVRLLEGATRFEQLADNASGGEFTTKEK